ncbi:MAG: PAS domain S-box protein [Chitinivibrionales bacterium]|nr:PAS domain S-box protein [Chitinivibrionales bacterium]
MEIIQREELDIRMPPAVDNPDSDALQSNVKSLEVQQNMIEEQLRRITGISSGIIYLIKPDGTFLFVNDAVESILHYRPQELIGRHFATILARGEQERVSRETVLPGYRGKITGPEGAPKLFNERRTRSRRTSNLEVSLLTKENLDCGSCEGDVTGIVSSEGAFKDIAKPGAKKPEMEFCGSQGIIYDITHYKRIEREKHELEKHLAEVEKHDMLGRFAGSIAHDLNNKLGIIVGYADILNSRIDSSVLSELLDKIVRSAQYCAEVTSQLLSFADERTFRIAHVNANELIEKVIRFLKHTISPRVHIKPYYHVDGPLIECDPAELQNAILKLAVQFGDVIGESGDLIFSVKRKKINQSAAREHGFISNADAFVRITIISARLRSSYEGASYEKSGSTTAQLPPAADKYNLSHIRQCLRRYGGFLECLRESETGIRCDMYLPDMHTGS